MTFRALLPAVLALAGLAWLLAGREREPAPRTPAAAPPPATVAPSLRGLGGEAGHAPPDVPVEGDAPRRTTEVDAPDPRRGRVVTADGRPVAGAGIAWWTQPPRGIYRGHRARQVDRKVRVHTDADGCFQLPPAFRPGQQLGVTKAGFLDQEAPWPRADGIDLVVLRRTLTVSGRVLDDRDQPVHSASVRVLDARPREVQLEDWRRSASAFWGPPGYEPPPNPELDAARTDERGAWSAHAPLGSMRIRVTLPAGSILEGALEVVPGADNHLTLRLQPAACLHLEVDPPTGAGGLDFAVHLSTGRAGVLDPERRSRARGRSTPEGRTVSLDLPPAGTPYWLIVYPGDATIPCHVEGPLIARGGSRRLVLPPDAHHGAEVRGAAPLPEGAFRGRVQARDDRGFTADAEVDKQTGRFHLRGLQPGAYELVVDVDGRRTLQRRIEVTRGEQLELGRVDTP